MKPPQQASDIVEDYYPVWHQSRYPTSQPIRGPPKVVFAARCWRVCIVGCGGRAVDRFRLVLLGLPEYHLDVKRWVFGRVGTSRGGDGVVICGDNRGGDGRTRVPGAGLLYALLLPHSTGFDPIRSTEQSTPIPPAPRGRLCSQPATKPDSTGAWRYHRWPDRH